MNRIKESKAFSYLLFIAVALMWGLSFVVIKNALDELSTYEVLAVRWGLSAIAFLILILLGVFKVDYKGKNIKALIPVVLCQPCLYSMLECTGIDRTTTSESSIIIAAVPIIVIIENKIIFGGKVGKKTILGVIIGFLGIALCLLFVPDIGTGSQLSGYISLLGAITVGGFYCVQTGRISSEFSVIEISAAMAMGGGVFYTILSLLKGNGSHPYEVFFQGGPTMWCIIFLGIGCGAICYIFYNYNLTRINPTISACIQTNAINIVGVSAGIYFANDPWGWYTVVGMILMSIGIVICALSTQNQ